MLDDRPFPSPFGIPAGPALSTPQLLSAYLTGAQVGSSPDAHIEGPVLMASDHPLAIRTDVAVLVRDEMPPVAQPLHAALCRALEAAGMVLTEGESVLAGALAMELAAPRGFEWSLWAEDPEEARAVLVGRAIGDLPAIPQADAPSDVAEPEIDAVLRRIERETWG